MTTKPSTRVKEVEETVDKAVEKTAENLKEAVDKTAEAVGVAVEKASKTAEKAAKAAEKVAQNGKDAVSEFQDSVFGKFLDHQKKAIEETGEALKALIPQGVKEHGASAYQEAMEGYRTLFNRLIDEIVETVEKAKIEPKEEKVAKPKAAAKKK